MDKSSAIGVAVAVGGILGGLMIDGGNVGQIIQPTAAMIVFGGTLGAVMLQFPLEVVLRSLKAVQTVFLHTENNVAAVIDQIVSFANKARKEGVVSLDKDLETIQEPFLKKALMLAVDGTQANELRATMEFELGYQTEQAERVCQVFDAGGGFAPTIGIIGAVLGLIQVMQHLDQINEVGRGIAAAFVATIYGVALANVVLLPIAGKLRLRLREKDLLRELMLEGVVGILEGVNPRMLQNKLSAYLSDAPAKAGKAEAKAGAPAGAAASAAAARS